MSKIRKLGPRPTAVRLLESVLDRGNNLGDAESENRQADPRDRAFARYLAYGVLRWLNALEWLAGQLLSKPLKSRDRDIQRLILIGLAELWKNETAAHATINECAGSARILGKPWAVSVINAVLRRFQREQEELLVRLENRDEAFAHPGWLLQALRTDWPRDWQQIVSANNQPAPLWLRLNRMHGHRDIMQGLESGGFTISDHTSAADAIKLLPAAPVKAIPGFEQGWLSVQDPAAQLAAHLLKAQKGERVLDACCAPGGKTCHLLEREPGIALTALDRSQDRLKLVAENLDRLGLGQDNTVRLIAGDASNPAEWWDGQPFNRILLDAPCTATGVIRRHPEIKWLRTPAHLADATRLQAQLLTGLWPLLETGGMLLYATCSVLKDENSTQIQHFVERHPEAEPVAIDAEWGQTIGFGRQVLPGQQEMDGFFYALLRKNQ